MPKPPKSQEVPAADSIAVWARLDAADHAELQRRQRATGATIGAQIRIIVREALNPRKRVLR